MNSLSTITKISLEAESATANLKAFSCSCVAGKGFCNHVVAILYQTAHYSQLSLQAVPPPLTCTSGLQRWHRPRTQGIHPEPLSELVVQKPKTVGQNGLRSTLYKAYTVVTVTLVIQCQSRGMPENWPQDRTTARSIYDGIWK
ncbi:uncharacterized protein LOC143729165 isoform X2 [Siphateles boraxobius]|uniref:uncharacterized protein LOC143729165 isoform X2 n=1 Tax=Siphateles boraxobius TaxID=180520 RepID=UPI004062BCA5